MKTFCVSRASKIYPNWDFWFENLPSGNPASVSKQALVTLTRWEKKSQFMGQVVANKIIDLNFVLFLQIHFVKKTCPEFDCEARVGLKLCCNSDNCSILWIALYVKPVEVSSKIHGKSLSEIYIPGVNDMIKQFWQFSWKSTLWLTFGIKLQLFWVEIDIFVPLFRRHNIGPKSISSTWIWTVGCL
jgi:hypothetical protein